MTKEMSALFDGELEQHEETALWNALKVNSRLQHTWRQYQLISDVMGDQDNLASDITGKVMTALGDEPVVFTPSAKRPGSRPGSLMALAASVAGVAVVGWLALAQRPPANESFSLTRSERVTPAPVVARAVPAPGMQEYMLAHQASASGLHLPGGAQHIRTVSAVGGGQ
jgi:sigma-E factor negative regulatory protein RseA